MADELQKLLITAMGPSKGTALTIICLVAASLLVWTVTNHYASSPRLLAATYTTTPTRTDNVNKFCVGKDRTNYFSQASVDTAAGYRASVQAQMNLDGNTLIKQLLNGQYSQSLDTVKTNPSGIIIFVISFLIGLILIIVLWPFLCCCCCCPSCCPSRCCQKPEDEQYTKCELYWPAITLILALLLAIAASAYGFTTAAGLGKGTRDLSCSTSMLIDDILNGNVTTDGKSFFVGMNQLLAQIGVINNQMGTINTQMKKLGVNDVTSQMKSYLQHGTDAKNAIDLIPTGVAGGSLSFTYGTPLNAIPTTGTITSNFGTVLGSTSSGGSGIVGALFNAVESGKGVLNAIATAADGFVASSGSFTSSVSQVTSTINDFKTTLTSGDNQIGGYFSSTQSGSSLAVIGVQVFYGVIIGFSTLALIGVLMMTFCDKYKCRHLMYFACIFLFVIGLLGFLISTIFSVLVPVLTFGCNYLTLSLSSDINFKANFGMLINSPTIDYVTVCLPTSSGDIVSVVGGGATQALKNLSATFLNISTFNGSALSKPLQDAVNAAVQTIQDYSSAKIADITDSSSLSILNNIANASKYSGCATAMPLMAGDSWVPSNNQNPTYVNCLSSLGNGGVAQCSTTANFNAGTNGCKGCMDSYKVLFTYHGTIGNRYTDPSCTTFNTELGNVWTNFYAVKYAMIGYDPTTTPTHQVVYFRALTAQTSINIFIADLTTNVPALFTTVQNALATISAIIDPQYGLVAGLNCRVFGEDIVRLSNTMCGPVYTTFYLSRLIVGIASYGILFALCCIVCAGVRHYKHGERKDKVQQDQQDLAKDADKFQYGTKMEFK